MKNAKINGIILFVVTVAILFYVLKDNFISTFTILKNANFLWILLAVFLYIIVFSLETMILRRLVNQYKSNYKVSSAFKLTIMTKFFNGITPFSAGGRPLQLIEFKKKGLKISEGTNVIVQNTIIFQSALLLFSITCLFLDGIFNFFSYNSLLNKMLFLGLILNGSLLLFSFLLSLSKTFNSKLVKIVINILSKIKIVKNKEKQTAKWQKSCDEYYECFKSFRKSRSLILEGIFIEIIALIIEYSIPICIFIALGETVGLNIFSCIVASNFVVLSGCYIPIPGGTGGMEYAFLEYFGNFASKTLMAPALILWRFISYYLPTLIGAFAFYIKSLRKGEKSNEKVNN